MIEYDSVNVRKSTNKDIIQDYMELAAGGLKSSHLFFTEGFISGLFAAWERVTATQ